MEQNNNEKLEAEKKTMEEELKKKNDVIQQLEKDATKMRNEIKNLKTCKNESFDKDEKIFCLTDELQDIKESNNKLEENLKIVKALPW